MTIPRLNITFARLLLLRSCVPASSSNGPRAQERPMKRMMKTLKGEVHRGCSAGSSDCRSETVAKTPSFRDLASTAAAAA